MCAATGWEALSKSATDGKDGADGKDGENGLDGASCTVKALASGSGYKVLCGGDSVGVILNGTNGKDGADYEEGCSLAEDRDGTVKFVCGKTDTVTLYKAICGSEAYDPAEKFCFADSAYDLCASKSYDPAMEFCANDSLFALCGGKSYDPLKMFCFADSAYDLCASKSYDPAMEFCANDSLFALCGGESYDPLKMFCFADSVYDLADSALVAAAISAACPALRFVTTEYLNQKMLADNSYGFLLDERDCQVYRTVTIGDQTWMAQNLNYASVDGNMDYQKGTFCYNNMEKNCDIYGKLYSWTASADMPSTYSTSKFVSEKRNEEKYQGACPAGYHIPQYEEVVTLLTYAGGVGSADNIGKLSSAFLWSDSTIADEYGLSLLPGGWFDNTYGRYSSGGYGNRFWLALDTKRTSAYVWGYSTKDREAGYHFDLTYNYQRYKFSIRCIKN